MNSTNTVWPDYTAGWLIRKFIHWTYQGTKMPKSMK